MPLASARPSRVTCDRRQDHPGAEQLDPDGLLQGEGRLGQQVQGPLENGEKAMLPFH